MKIYKAPLEGVWLIEPTVLQDERGFFYESFRLDQFREQTGLTHIHFVQDNHSSSKKGVVRGLHFQIPPHGMSKLVRCTKGAVLDVVVDLRKNSGTYGSHYSVELSEENRLQIFVPVGFAHGFIALSDCEVIYKCDTFYHRSSDSGIKFNDPDLGIDLIFNSQQIIMSAKDKTLVSLKDFVSPFN